MSIANLLVSNNYNLFSNTIGVSNNVFAGGSLISNNGVINSTPIVTDSSANTGSTLSTSLINGGMFISNTATVIATYTLTLPSISSIYSTFSSISPSVSSIVNPTFTFQVVNSTLGSVTSLVVSPGSGGSLDSNLPSASFSLSSGEIVLLKIICNSPTTYIVTRLDN